MGYIVQCQKQQRPSTLEACILNPWAGHFQMISKPLLRLSLLVICAAIIYLWTFPCGPLSFQSLTSTNGSRTIKIVDPELRIYAEPDAQEYVAICLAVKNEPIDLRESLIHHYHHLGVRRFYIMDDGSSPPLSSYDYGVPRQIITHHYFPAGGNRSRVQNHLYNACTQLHGSKHTWIAYIDADEFFEMTGDVTFVGLLKELGEDPAVGALAVNWKTHSSSNLIARPSSSRHAFVTCITDGPDIYGHPSPNTLVKSIVKTANYISPNSPHDFLTADGTWTYGEWGRQRPAIPEWRQDPVSRDRIALHHYVLKSREQFEEKIARGNAMDHPKSWLDWKYIEEKIQHVSCQEMTIYKP